MPTKNNIIHQAALRACEAAVDKKGEDVVLLDLKGQTAAADYFIIVTSHSKPQSKAIAQGIEDALKEFSLQKRGVEGYPHAGWILLDYHAIVIHIFIKEERDYYNLEKLWSPKVTASPS